MCVSHCVVCEPLIKKGDICDYAGELIVLSANIFRLNILLFIYPKGGLILLQCHQYLLSADNACPDLSFPG